MINMLIPAAIAFLIIFITVGYECYNKLAAKEREFRDHLNEVRDMTLMLKKVYDKEAGIAKEVTNMMSINSDEIRRLKEEIKALKSKKQ